MAVGRRRPGHDVDQRGAAVDLDHAGVGHRTGDRHQ